MTVNDSAKNDVRSEIDKCNRRFEEYMAAADLDGILGLYADEAISLPSGTADVCVMGHDGIRDWFAKMLFEQGSRWIALGTISLIDTGNGAAIEVGRFDIGPTRDEIADSGLTLPPESVPVGSIESVLDQEANQWQEGNGIRPSRS